MQEEQQPQQQEQQSQHYQQQVSTQQPQHQQQQQYNGGLHFLELFRVKVYRLNGEGQWDDKGTGHVSLEMQKGGNWVSELPRDQEDTQADQALRGKLLNSSFAKSNVQDDQTNGLHKQQNGETITRKCLVVLSEGDHRCLLIHQVQGLEIYQRQGDDTIITWADPQLGTDIALSFQEVVGCNQIWESLQNSHGKASGEDDQQFRRDSSSKMHTDYLVQARMGNNNRLVDEYDTAQVRLHDSEQISKGSTGFGMSQQPIDLPQPQTGNLKEFAGMLSEVSALQREQVASQILKQGHVSKLLQIFQQCEDLEDVESLKYLFFIVKGLILLNDSEIFKEMFKEDNMMSVIGALEYDPDASQRFHHREHLNQVKFKQVIPISDPETLSKIHQTYHISYIKDNILPTVLDDPTFATLHSLIVFNNIDVLNSLQSQPDFIQQLFQQLRTKSENAIVNKENQENPNDSMNVDEDTATHPWVDLVQLLHEICSMAKNCLQGNDKDNMFSNLLQEGLLDVTTELLQKGDVWARFKCANILQSVLLYSPITLRDYFHKNDNVMGHIVRGLLSHSDDGLPEQMGDIIKGLLDIQSTEHNFDDNPFLTRFYERHMMTILECMEKGAKDPTFSPFTLGLLLDILILCIEKHAYQFKYFCLKQQAADKVVALTQRRESWIVVGAVRCIRRMLGQKDDFYYRYLMRHDMFKPIVDVFLLNGDKYNLLNSAVLELFEFVKNESIECLIEHLYVKFYPKLAHVTYVSTISQLKAKYEQIKGKSSESRSMDDSGNNSSSSSQFNHYNDGPHVKRRRLDSRQLEKEQEDYFNSVESDSGEEDNQQNQKVMKKAENKGQQRKNGSVNVSNSNRSPNGVSSPDRNQKKESSSGFKGQGVLLVEIPLVNYGDDDHDEDEDMEGEKEGEGGGEEMVDGDPQQQTRTDANGPLMGEMCNSL